MQSTVEEIPETNLQLESSLAEAEVQQQIEKVQENEDSDAPHSENLVDSEVANRGGDT